MTRIIIIQNELCSHMLCACDKSRHTVLFVISASITRECLPISPSAGAVFPHLQAVPHSPKTPLLQQLFCTWVCDDAGHLRGTVSVLLSGDTS